MNGRRIQILKKMKIFRQMQVFKEIRASGETRMSGERNTFGEGRTPGHRKVSGNRKVSEGRKISGERKTAKRRFADASITVEAVLVLPFTIILFLMLLWLSLYLHDKCVIEGALFQTLEEGGEYILYGVSPGIGLPSDDGGSRSSLRYAIADASEEEMRIWEERFSKEISGKLFLYRLSELDCQKTITGTRAYARFCCAEFFPAGQWGLSELFCMEYVYDRLCPVREEVTRAGSILLDFYEEKRK